MFYGGLVPKTPMAMHIPSTIYVAGTCLPWCPLSSHSCPVFLRLALLLPLPLYLYLLCTLYECVCVYLLLYLRRTAIPVSKKILTISPKTLPHTNSNAKQSKAKATSTTTTKQKAKEGDEGKRSSSCSRAELETRWDAQRPSHNSGPRIVIDTRKALQTRTHVLARSRDPRRDP